MELLEEQKIVDCQSGNLENFGGLYNLYAEKIYRYLYYRVRHKETAQDLTSQTFFKALDSIKNFDSTKGQFSSWLYRIAKNLLIDYYRTQKNHFDIDQLWDLTGGQNLAHDAEIREKIVKVKESLAGLDQGQREIVILRVWDELSYREISQVVGKSEDNCKMIFSRAIGKLRKEKLLALALLFLLINQVT